MTLYAYKKQRDGIEKKKRKKKQKQKMYHRILYDVVFEGLQIWFLKIMREKKLLAPKDFEDHHKINSVRFIFFTTSRLKRKQYKLYL